MTKFEVCAGSLDDCIAAYKGGADRIELNSALHLGGLTPSLATLKLAKKEVNIPICCMVRPRACGFNYTEKEIEVIFAETKDLLDNNADGIVFGFLKDDNDIDIELTKKMVDLIHSYNKEAIFHRAFDCLYDPYKGIETLIELKVDRVLTSGLKSKAPLAKEMIKDLQDKYGDKIQILAGSGVNAKNVLDLVNDTGIKQVHSSCKGWLRDNTTHVNSDVDYSYVKDSEYEIVDVNLVRELKEIISNM